MWPSFLFCPLQEQKENSDNMAPQEKGKQIHFLENKRFKTWLSAQCSLGISFQVPEFMEETTEGQSLCKTYLSSFPKTLVNSYFKFAF